jgi:hypothetical protein
MEWEIGTTERQGVRKGQVTGDRDRWHRTRDARKQKEMADGAQQIGTGHRGGEGAGRRGRTRNRKWGEGKGIGNREQGGGEVFLKPLCLSGMTPPYISGRPLFESPPTHHTWSIVLAVNSVPKLCTGGGGILDI